MRFCRQRDFEFPIKRLLKCKIFCLITQYLDLLSLLHLFKLLLTFENWIIQIHLFFLQALQFLKLQYQKETVNLIVMITKIKLTLMMKVNNIQIFTNSNWIFNVANRLQARSWSNSIQSVHIFHLITYLLEIHLIILSSNISCSEIVIYQRG